MLLPRVLTASRRTAPYHPGPPPFAPHPPRRILASAVAAALAVPLLCSGRVWKPAPPRIVTAVVPRSVKIVAARHDLRWTGALWNVGRAWKPERPRIDTATAPRGIAASAPVPGSRPPSAGASWLTSPIREAVVVPPSEVFDDFTVALVPDGACGGDPPPDSDEYGACYRVTFGLMTERTTPDFGAMQLLTTPEFGAMTRKTTPSFGPMRRS